ncbi:MAG TPA: response regulator [Anaerolineae bacterium]
MNISPVRTPIDPKQAHILVVEDNVSNFVLVARLLAFMGVQKCEWKTTGWGVVDFANTMSRVDLILMDLRLPHEDGYDALRQIRADTRLQDTLVVVVTAHGSTAEMQKAREAGFDGFLTKPLDPDHFPEQIRQILSGEPVWDLGI